MRLPPRHAIIHLPVLSPDEAKLVMRVLDRVIDAVWRAHGPAIEFQDEADHALASEPASAPASESTSPPEPASQLSLDEIF